MLTLMRLSVVRKNLIETVKGVVKLKGKRSKLVKIIFVRTLTLSWVI